MRSLVATFLAVSIALPALAFPVVHADKRYQTQLTGFVSPEHTIVKRVRDKSLFWALSGLRIRRIEGETCSMGLAGERYTGYRGNLAEPSPPPSLGRCVAFDSSLSPFVRVDPQHVVRSVSLCMNSRQEIEGVRLKSTFWRADGTHYENKFKTSEWPKELTAECTWSREAKCNFDDVAIGAHFFHDGRQYRGMRLTCAPADQVTLKPVNLLAP